MKQTKISEMGARQEPLLEADEVIFEEKASNNGGDRSRGSDSGSGSGSGRSRTILGVVGRRQAQSGAGGVDCDGVRQEGCSTRHRLSPAPGRHSQAGVQTPGGSFGGRARQRHAGRDGA